jgi:RNA:NAD 2'-phosphotransferase (TPT1/KptA family)
LAAQLKAEHTKSHATSRGLMVIFLLKIKDMSKQLSEISKFLSYVLRHQSDALGITLDRERWTDIGD